jgi:hypothetical protein
MRNTKGHCGQNVGFTDIKRLDRCDLEDPGLDGRIILKWIFERLYRGAGTGSVWLRIGTGGGLL